MYLFDGMCNVFIDMGLSINKLRKILRRILYFLKNSYFGGFAIRPGVKATNLSRHLRAVDGEGFGWVCAGLETYHVITLVDCLVTGRTWHCLNIYLVKILMQLLYGNHSHFFVFGTSILFIVIINIVTITLTFAFEVATF